MRKPSTDTTRSIATFGGVLGVIGVAAYASWEHIVHLSLRAGERAEVAPVLPISVDGMLVVSAAMMARDRAMGRRPRLSARVAFWIGVGATTAANIASANPPAGLAWQIGARMISAWPAVALLLTVEMLYRRGKVDEDPAPATVVAPAPAPAVITPTIEVMPTPAPMPAMPAMPDVPDVAAIAPLPVPMSPVVADKPQLNGSAKVHLNGNGRDLMTAALATVAPPYDAEQLSQLTGLSLRSVQRYLSELLNV